MSLFRITCFFTLLLASMFLSPWALVPFVVVYAFRWHAYELLIAAACIDAYLGLGMGLPYYTLGTGCVLIVLEWLKPSLSFYTERD